jgi:histidinol phosphatase-like enzyme
LIDKACRDFDIDLTHSFFIGDRECDIKTGQNAGINTILVRTGYGTEEEKKGLNPDYITDNLKSAVDIIRNYAGGQSR